MKRATKARPPKWLIAQPPEAESGHNLYVAIRELTNVVKGIDGRTRSLEDMDARLKRLEAAVVPPRSFGQRVKSAVGM